MLDELITAENLSKEFLKSILDTAYMETSYDEDGDLTVKERCSCFVFPDEEDKSRIRLMTIFSFKSESSELDRLQSVNRINSEYAIVKATVRETDRLVFNWDIPIAGGITKKAFVLAVKKFCLIPHDAVADCANDIIF